MAKKQPINRVKPVEEIRIGNVKAAIWKNESDGKTWFNVTVQRLYRTPEGEWRSAANFGRDDLLLVAKLLNAVHTRVMQLIGEARGTTQANRPAA